MIRKAKVEIPFPFFPPITRCMIPFPSPSLLVRKSDLCRGDRNTVVIVTETFLTPPNYNFSHIGNKVSL